MPIDWDSEESRFAEFARPRLAKLVHRSAFRLVPVVAEAAEVYGPEALEWLNALKSSLVVLEVWIADRSLSRFTLDLAAEIARCAATAGTNAARMLGHSKSAEQAELAFAAGAFAVDVARANSPIRAARFAVQSLRAVQASGLIPQELLLNESEVLWPDGEPAWSRNGWMKFENAGAMPRILQMPS